MGGDQSVHYSVFFYSHDSMSMYLCHVLGTNAKRHIPEVENDEAAFVYIPSPPASYSSHAVYLEYLN